MTDVVNHILEDITILCQMTENTMVPKIIGVMLLFTSACPLSSGSSMTLTVKSSESICPTSWSSKVYLTSFLCLSVNRSDPFFSSPMLDFLYILAKVATYTLLFLHCRPFYLVNFESLLFVELLVIQNCMPLRLARQTFAILQCWQM